MVDELEKGAAAARNGKQRQAFLSLVFFALGSNVLLFQEASLFQLRRFRKIKRRSEKVKKKRSGNFTFTSPPPPPLRPSSGGLGAAAPCVDSWFPREEADIII